MDDYNAAVARQSAMAKQLNTTVFTPLQQKACTPGARALLDAYVAHVERLVELRARAYPCEDTSGRNQPIPGTPPEKILGQARDLRSLCVAYLNEGPKQAERKPADGARSGSCSDISGLGGPRITCPQRKVSGASSPPSTPQPQRQPTATGASSARQQAEINEALSQLGAAVKDVQSPQPQGRQPAPTGGSHASPATDPRKPCMERGEDFLQTGPTTGHCVPRGGTAAVVGPWLAKYCEDRPGRPPRTAAEKAAISKLGTLLRCRADEPTPKKGQKSIGDRTACNQLVGQGLELLFGNTDLKTGKGKFDFVLANDIAQMLAAGHRGWLLIGEATDQRTLDKAQEWANAGRAVVAAKSNPSGAGHVALIIPGTTQAYTFWHKPHLGDATYKLDWGDLRAPNAAALSLDDQNLMFVGCPLSAAGWKQPNGVKLYYKP
jgi:hypothetical protein